MNKITKSYFNKIINEIVLNSEESKNKTKNILLKKIKEEEKKHGVTFLEGLEKYYDNSIPENERYHYYTFFLYFQGLNNCLKNDK